MLVCIHLGSDWVLAASAGVGFSSIIGSMGESRSCRDERQDNLEDPSYSTDSPRHY